MDKDFTFGLNCFFDEFDTKSEFGFQIVRIIV